MRGGDGVGAAEEGLVFIGPACVVDDTVDGGGEFGGGFFAVCGEVCVDEFGGACFEHFGDAVEDLSAVVGGAVGPGWMCFGGGFGGVADVFAGAEWDVCEELAGGIVDGVGEVGFGTDEGTADGAFGGFGDGDAGHGDRVGKSLKVGKSKSRKVGRCERRRDRGMEGLIDE